MSPKETGGPSQEEIQIYIAPHEPIRFPKTGETGPIIETDPNDSPPAPPHIDATPEEMKKYSQELEEWHKRQELWREKNK